MQTTNNFLVYEQKFDPAQKSRPANMNSAMEVKTPGIKPRHVIEKKTADQPWLPWLPLAMRSLVRLDGKRCTPLHAIDSGAGRAHIHWAEGGFLSQVTAPASFCEQAWR